MNLNIRKKPNPLAQQSKKFEASITSTTTVANKISPTVDLNTLLYMLKKSIYPSKDFWKPFQALQKEKVLLHGYS